MNPVRRWTRPGLLVAVDFGSSSVTALLAERRDGGMRIVGKGEAPSAGVEKGEIVRPGDAAEAIREALRRAESAAAAPAERLYFNLDDAGLESRRASGSRTLLGEGEIEASDVQAAREAAERGLEDFERKIVYSRPLEFLVDERDRVQDPLGIYARKLDVELHVLRARARVWDTWRRVLERAFAPPSVLVLSPWSTAYGVLPKEDRARKRLIVDAGRDFLNIFGFGNNMITSCRTVSADALMADRQAEGYAERIAALAAEAAAKDPGTEQVLVAGDLAEDENLLERLRTTTRLPVHVPDSRGAETAWRPADASAAGLLAVAEELERLRPTLRRDTGAWTALRAKAAEFFNEYF